MPIIKRTILIMFTLILCISSLLVTFTQAKAESLQKIQQELNQKAQEKQAIHNDIKNVQQEIDSLNTYISKNKAEMAATQTRIANMNQLIEAKKAEIVVLEDKILARKDVMKKRLVALQHDNNFNLVIKVILDSKNFNDFLQRASAVTALFNADQSILDAQKEDLKQIEIAKKEIDSEQQKLIDAQNVLAKQEADLSKNLQKRQVTLTAMQQKYSQIDEQMGLVQNQLKAAQEKIRQEQEAARQATLASSPPSGTTAQPVGKGEEMYVTATAYSPQSSGATTTLGYNIKANPNMKLIAVDPSVIPLGKKVWVEGYGVAIAGDTGGAIKGHIIDVLMPTNSAALSWGRKTVKIVILN
ncbi:MAG TPA: 3D domain-containing protein [Bacillales bacterium]|nr:3D domain-containing protein [Bacillales bacterium]